MQIKTEEILIKGSRNKKNYCDIFCYQPENIEEASLGNLYIVSEIANDDNPSHITNLLNSVIKREYYCRPHKGALESLESSMKKANMVLNEMANQGNLSWLGQLHLVCGVFNKSDLFLCQAGQAQVWLNREGELTNITKKFVPSPEKPHPAKIFQSIISGKIEPWDKFFFSTPTFFDLFDNHLLKQLLSMPKAEAIADQINKTAREQKKAPSLGTLIIETRGEEEMILNRETQDFITPPISLEEIFSN